MLSPVLPKCDTLCRFSWDDGVAGPDVQVRSDDKEAEDD